MSRVVCAVAAAAFVFSSCGESEEEKRTKRDSDFAKHSPADVKDRFEEVTGVHLRQSLRTRNGLLEILRVDVKPGAGGAYSRYGGVSISVTGNKYTLDSVTERSTGGDRKIIDNVVVEGVTSSGDGKSFDRAVRVLSSLGKPASSVKLPPEETPCEKADIEEGGGSGEEEGRCLSEKQQELTIVNSDSDLEVEGRTLSGVAVKTGTTLTSSRFGLRRSFRARGAFVAVSYEIENTGNQPLTSLRPNLVIDDRSYSEDSRRSFYVMPEDVFPLQPGDTARTITLFDIPQDAARDAIDEGVLEISGDGDRTLTDYAESIGRIRLDGAGRTGPRVRGGLSS